MTGTANQIEWAEQIKTRVAAEFDRVARALESAAGNQSEKNKQAVIEILADKRAEVMARDQAGYFIVEWQELRDQVRKLITQDPRYQTIRSGITAKIQV